MSIKAKTKASGLSGTIDYQLTKTTYTFGVQCLKRLYMEKHEPALATPDAPSTELRKMRGVEIGNLAHSLYPKGILIERDSEKPAHEATREAMENGALTIFEATFIYDGVLVRLDVLNRKNKKAPWQLIEVKSSIHLKKEHLPDLAIQTWVLKNCKVPLEGTYLMHVDNSKPFPATQDLMKLTEDLSEEIDEHIEEVPKRIKEMKKVLSSKKPPEAKIGTQCEAPWKCPFKEQCWKNVPEPSILDLYRYPVDERYDLYHSGIVKITDKRIEPTNEIAKRMIEVEKKKKPHFNKELVRNKLTNEWQLPYYYLDFETISTPIPRFNKVKPYNKVPIQFSLHIQEKQNGKATHKEYLHSDGSDPRPAIAKALCEAIGNKGTILAFNGSFEAAILKSLAAAVPKYASQLKLMAERIEDPQILFREAIYDSKFLGSFSLKIVAPAILGAKFDYNLLEISEGGAVELFFDEMNQESTPGKKKEELRKQLLAYCKVDTEALVELTNWLWSKLSKGE